MSVDYSELEKLFNLARRTAPNERQELIDTVCGTNELLKEKIIELLQADSTHDEMLDDRAGMAELLAGQFPQAGCKLGPYDLEKVIGAGGMATVFLAYQQSPIQRHVALKVVKESRICQKAIGRFEAEKQALATIDHPFVTKIFDAGVSEDGLFYFSMEYVDGQAITKYCDVRKMGIDERLRLFCDVCDGIEHAHQKGIVHRDIKPSNILVSESSGSAQPKIIDFGIAKALDNFQDEVEFLEATRDGIMIGTPQYMSPEQADMRHESIDSRADVFSLGVVLHELVTGETPLGSLIKNRGLLKAFELARYSMVEPPSNRVIAIEDQQVFENRATTREKLLKKLKSDLEAVILKATNGDPEHRYQSARELRDDVERFCKGQPVHASRFDMVSSFRKWLGRNKFIAATVVLVLAAVSVATWISMHHAQKASNASLENQSLRARFVDDQRELCEANNFRQRVEHCELAKKAYKTALDRYLNKNCWITGGFPDSESDLDMSSFHSLLESDLKSNGLGPIIPSEFNLDEVEIPLLAVNAMIEDPFGMGPLSMGPLGGGAFSIAVNAGDESAGIFDSPEDIVERQNNTLCELIYEEQKLALGDVNEILANTCDIWAQYLIECRQYDRAEKLVEEAAAIRMALGSDLLKGPTVFNLFLHAKCNYKQRKRRKADQLMLKGSEAMAAIEMASQKRVLLDVRRDLQQIRDAQRFSSFKVFLRNLVEALVRSLFLPQIESKH